jgi:integrase
LRRNQESGRDVYMSDAVFDAIRSAGDATVRDAMDLARRTGMDVSVILQARRADVVGDELQLRRSKTGVPVRYRLREPDGELNELGRVVQDMLTRERHATGMRLVQDDKGQGVPYNTFSKRFDRARLGAGYQSGEYQFRDIRPKVATDQQDVQRAQDLLGHKHISTTERHYIRRGKLVDPAK